MVVMINMEVMTVMIIIAGILQMTLTIMIAIIPADKEEEATIIMIVGEEGLDMIIILAVGQMIIEMVVMGADLEEIHRIDMTTEEDPMEITITTTKWIE